VRGREKVFKHHESPLEVGTLPVPEDELGGRTVGQS
jgi:hypothetical protein